MPWVFQSFPTARGTIQGFEAMLWLHKGGIDSGNYGGMPTVPVSDSARAPNMPQGAKASQFLKNAGKVDHEFMLNSIANNAKHKVAMEANPNMEHDEPEREAA